MTTWKIKTIICVSSYLAIAYLLLLWSTSPSYFFILLSNCMLVKRMMTNKSQIPSPPPPHPKAALMHPTNRLVDFLLQAPAPPWPPQLSAIKPPPPSAPIIHMLSLNPVCTSNPPLLHLCRHIIYRNAGFFGMHQCACYYWKKKIATKMFITRESGQSLWLKGFLNNAKKCNIGWGGHP